MEDIGRLRNKVLASESIRRLTETEGWRVLEDEFKQEIERLKERLLNCPIEEIEKIRGQINCFKAIFNTVNLVMQKGKIAEEEIEEIEKEG